MRRSRRPIIIASRCSRLARAQAEGVGEALSRLHAGVEVRYVWIDSEGDTQPEATLDASGGKGLFIRAVEQALLMGRADLAVHSLKDIPAEVTAGLAIAAIPAREDVRDCLIAAPGVTGVRDLPPGAVVGTSGPRRAAQLKRLRPDLDIQPIRGNIETRLAKVLGEEAVMGQASGVRGHGCGYDATLLALAGLRRAALDRFAVVPLSIDEMLPAAGQAALAIQCRADDHVSLTRCLPLNDPDTAASVHAERAVVAGLSGDCHSPIAAYAQPLDDELVRLRVRVLSPDGTACLACDEQARVGRDLARLAKRMVRDLQARGADVVMHGAKPRQAARAVAPAVAP